MTWLAPAAFAWLALSGALIAIYLLRPRRERVVVASLMLWRRYELEVTGSAFWRWLRRHLLLILQMLALVTLALALARPELLRPLSTLPDLVLVIDGSSRLMAPGRTGSRFDDAKAAAVNYLRSMESPVAATVILATETPRAVLQRERGRPATEGAIGRLEAGSGPAAMSLALNMARSILAAGPGGSIAIVSDGLFEVDDPALLERAGLVDIGPGTGNLAIERIAVRAQPAGGNQILVAVNSSFADARTVEVALFSGDRQVASRPLQIGSNGRAVAIFEAIEAGEDLKAELHGTGSNLDGDDQAFLTVGAPADMRAAVVSREASAYLRALDAMPGLLVQEVDPDSYDPAAEFDLYVFDRFLPAALPAGSLIVINPPSNNPWFAGAEESTGSLALRAEGARLLDFVDMAFLDPGEAAGLPVPAWAIGDVLKDDGAAIYHGVLQGRRTVVVGFDPVQTGMTSWPAFPIFVHNAVQWANPLRALPPGTRVAPGERTPATPHPRASRIEVLGPRGQRLVTLEAKAGASLGPFKDPGVYRLRQMGAKGAIAEETFVVGPRLNTGAAQPGNTVLPSPPPLPAPQDQDETQRTGMWTWLGLGAMLLLAVEWAWFHRVRAAS